MKTIKELREQKARLATEARGIIDAVPDTADQAAIDHANSEFDRRMAEVNRLDGEIERRQRLDALEADLQRGDARRPQGENLGQRDASDHLQNPSYREAFRAMLQVGGDLSAMSQEHRAALRAGVVTLTPEERAQTAGTAAAGGYTVPTELQATIVRAMAAWGPMYDEDICTALVTDAGNPLPMPTVDDTASTAEPTTEGAELTNDGGKDVTFGQKSLGAYTYDTEWLQVSYELMADSVFNMEAVLSDLLAERLARIANARLTVGTGSGQPQGIVTGAAGGKTLASTTAITADEVLDLVHSVDPAYRSNPKTRAMFNDATLLALRKLKDGDGNYLITEAADGSGRLRIGSVIVPYSINQAMLGLGGTSRKVMTFGDFSKYYVRKVGGPLIGVAREKFWPLLGIAGLIRFDGLLADTRAVKSLVTAAS